MGPKREYGVEPWPPKSHDDPQNVDDYPTHHIDAASVGHNYGGDICPYCGVPLPNDEQARAADGEKGTIWDLARDDVTVPVYHEQCYQDRTAEKAQLENTTLGEWSE
jgi:hypothetical protein